MAAPGPQAEPDPVDRGARTARARISRSDDSPSPAGLYDGPVLTDVLRDLWNEPAPEPPGRSRVDGAIVVVLAVLGLLDGLLSSEVGWPAISIPVMVLLPIVLFWRRTDTLVVAVIVSATYVALHGAMLVAGVAGTALNVGVIIVTVYTLARWASGRQAIIGLAVVTVAIVAAGSTLLFRDPSGAIGFPSFIAFFALAGVAVRLWSSRGVARLGEAKMAERNRIARELHDTVAHHVSAIAVQAQGGQVMLETDPSAAGQALAVIEQQASSALSEMRLILGVLRDQDPADLAPSRGLADIMALADQGGPGPLVDVELSGDLADLGPSLESALVRVAQEAVTNARRHAAGASRVRVEVTGTERSIRLRVTDDGEEATAGGSGYGLLGMQERATLLGGTCDAGPAPAGGWVVRAVLPRNGGSG